MGILELNKYFGTAGADNLPSPARSITFGLGGDDILSSGLYSKSNVLAGGSGNDTYHVGKGSQTAIVDTGGIDHVVAPSLGFNDRNTYVATVDGGRHIAVGNVVDRTLLVIANWQSPANSIESIRLSDGTYSLSFISGMLSTRSNYIGDFSIARLVNDGLLPPGTSSSDAQAFIDYVSQTENSKTSELAVPVTTTENSTLSVIVESWVLGRDPVYLDGLNEKRIYKDGNLVFHTIEYAGTVFNYEDVDPLIMTVTRDGEFTQEFAKEISDYAPEFAGISYQTAVQLLGVQNIDPAIILVAGADGFYVS